MTWIFIGRTDAEAEAPILWLPDAKNWLTGKDTDAGKDWRPEKDVLSIIGDWNAKVGNREIPGVTGKFGFGIQNEAGQRLTEFCQETTLAIANTLIQQHKRWLYTWTSPRGQYWNEIDYILCSQSWRSSKVSKKRPGADCCSNKQFGLLPNSDLNWRI